MSARSQERKARDEDNVVFLVAVATLAGLSTVGPPALLAGLALEPLARRYRRELALAALAGLALGLSGALAARGRRELLRSRERGGPPQFATAGGREQRPLYPAATQPPSTWITWPVM